MRQSAPRFVKVQTKFDYSEHKPYAEPGENEISGQGYLDEHGGNLVTCSGNRVLLLPATSYFRETFWHMVVARNEPEPLESPYPSLKSMIKRTECDAEGKFSLSGIPNGNWFILTEVNAPHGGVLITEVTLPNQGTTLILLTNKHVVGR